MTMLLLVAALLSWPAGAARPHRRRSWAGLRHTGLHRISLVGGRALFVLTGVFLAGLATVLTGSALVGLAVVVSWPTGWLLGRSAWQQQRRSRLRSDSMEAIRALARELQAGSGLEAAVQSVVPAAGALSRPLLGRLAMAARMGSVDAIGAAADSNPVERSLHAAVRMSQQCGIPLAGLMFRLADGLEDETLADEQRAAAVAGAKLSGYLLAGLPLVGVLLGLGMGANPIPVLLGGGLGSVLLLVGVILSCSGLLWSARIAS